MTDYLVAKAQASAALSGVLVLDGPQPPAAWQSSQQVLWFGADPAALGNAAAESVQVFATAFDHARNRDEDGTITCAARHWTGDKTIKTHRDGAAAIVGAVEDILRGVGDTGDPGDASMGGLVLWSQVSRTQWFPSQKPNGAEVLVVFDVSFRARLTTS